MPFLGLFSFCLFFLSKYDVIVFILLILLLSFGTLFFSNESQKGEWIRMGVEIWKNWEEQREGILDSEYIIMEKKPFPTKRIKILYKKELCLF